MPGKRKQNRCDIWMSKESSHKHHRRFEDKNIAFSRGIFVLMFIRVALPVPRLEPLTYQLDIDAPAGIGYRVVVPLGKRMVTGTIVEVGVASVDNVKSVVEILDECPTFSAELLELTKRVAEYYLCSWGEVLHAAMPGGMQPNAVMRIRIERPLSTSEYEAIKRKAPKRARLLSILDEASGELTLAYLQKLMKSSSVADQLHALLRDGWISIVYDLQRQTSSRTVRCVTVSNHLLDNEAILRSTLDELDRRAPKQSLALAYIYLHRDKGPVTVSSVSHNTGVAAASIDTLIEKGLLEEVIRDYIYGNEHQQLTQRNERDLVLSTQQSSAVDAVMDNMSEGTFHVHLLQGVTGSGKTLVYQRLIDQAKQMGRGSLILVPEISLTPQLGDRFRSLYGDDVAVLHSRLSMGERVQIWNRVSRGEVHVVIGPRSAVFVDIPNLGIIIVDEEHEPSYKQDDPAPRYNGRDVAIMRAQISKCPIVLGSATPSLETFHHANLGRYTRHLMPERADGASFPNVRLIDMRQARKMRQLSGSFAVETLAEIAERLKVHQGVLVFLNRRGFASQIQCSDCGSVPMCSNCDVALTYHKYPGVMKCHYCGYGSPFYNACTTCGGTELAELGSGTQRIEEELVSSLTSYIDRPIHVARMDADTTSRKGQHRKLLQQFSDGTIDVLVGTQMIAKGLDIDRCTLVVVVNADQSLYQGDFRASERTLQLMLQVSGRAGRRAGSPGLVLLQTSTPEHSTMRMCLLGESHQSQLAEWYAEERASRSETQYPPYARFITIELQSFAEDVVQHHAEIVWAMLPKDDKSLCSYPPVPPAVARLRNIYRRIIVIKNDRIHDPSGQICRGYLRTLLNQYYASHAHRDVRLTVDMDARGSW
jgi:primosomal protein N' (replication factor Y)